MLAFHGQHAIALGTVIALAERSLALSLFASGGNPVLIRQKESDLLAKLASPAARRLLALR